MCASLRSTTSFQDIEAFRTEIDQLAPSSGVAAKTSKDQLPLLPGDEPGKDRKMTPGFRKAIRHCRKAAGIGRARAGTGGTGPVHDGSEFRA